jgi:hypothetical protein
LSQQRSYSASTAKSFQHRLLAYLSFRQPASAAVDCRKLQVQRATTTAGDSDGVLALTSGDIKVS